MNTSEYLDRLLLHYSGTFNIYQPYVINGKEYPYYGLFYNCTEKYVLVREVNMWSSKSYEHILFMEAEELTDEIYQEKAETYMAYYGFETVEDLETAYTKETVMAQVISDMAVDFLVENAAAEEN